MNLIAHRGLWDKSIKSNSYEAIKKGLESSKYIGIECDIRMTKDEEFIIYHNILYKGLLVRSIPYKDIKKDVCKLEDILKIKTNKIFLLEIKDFNLNKQKLLNVLKKYKRNIYLMSFNTKIIEDLRNINSSYKYGILNYVLNSSDKYNLDFICLLDVIATDYVISSFKKRNIDVLIYGTITPNRNLTYIVDDKDLEK